MISNDNIIDLIKNLRHDPLPKRSDAQIDSLVSELMGKMTLEEKIGQLFQSAPPEAHVEGLVFEGGQKTVEYIKKGKCGSILGVSDPVNAYRIQRLAVEESRLGIPLFFGLDIIHGCRTAFPLNLAMSCSFDPELIEEVCKVAASETAHTGITVTYSPMVDIVRDPRWGRVVESSGEDPYLSRAIARAYIRGYQQGDLTSYNSVAACVKHFAAYGAIEAGREYNTVDMSDRHLRMYYLPPYQSCVDEEAAAIMSAFNIVDGVPATSSKYLLTDILRNEWGYKGFVISDYTSTIEIINHKAAKDEKETALRCILAGLDHEMVAMSYADHLQDLVTEGKIDESLIDQSCARILRFKYKTGLFDNPYKNIYPRPEDFYRLPSYIKTALKAAQRSIVLLKNNNVLPVSKNKKIALIGPGAVYKALISAWGGLALDSDCVTLVEGMKNYGFDFETEEGCSFESSENDESQIEKAYEMAKTKDIIILAIGEKGTLCGESASRSDISVTGAQKRLVEKLKTLNKPIIGVIFSGRPLDLTWYNEQLDAMLQTWYLGNEAGNAIASVLLGEYNPSGKLTMSFPRSVGQIPIYYNHYPTGRPSSTGGPMDSCKSSYIDIPNAPLFPFGYGLSYTNFSYSNLTLSQNTLKDNEKLTASINVQNTGDFSGEEVVQLYIECISFSVTRPVKELKGFRKILLAPGESNIVEFTLTTQDLAYINIDRKFTAENTDYKIFIGTDSTVDQFKTVSVL